MCRTFVNEWTKDLDHFLITISKWMYAVPAPYIQIVTLRC